MTYLVSLKRSAEKELSELPVKIHDNVLERLITLKESPRPAGVKKLRRREGYRIRVGEYRILYLIDDAKQIVEIISIAHRREVYRR